MLKIKKVDVIRELVILPLKEIFNEDEIEAMEIIRGREY